MHCIYREQGFGEFSSRIMAAGSTAESLLEEVSCPICLDYFTDPVITDCGHNFCRSCITQAWEGLDTNFPCPQCRETSQQRNLRPNRQLGNVTDMLKKLPRCLVRKQEENLCEKHEEKLKLFCTEDQRPICIICKEGKDHRSHPVIPIEEAVLGYKEKYEIHLASLRKELREILELKSSEERKVEELESKTEIRREKILSEFEKLHQFLNEEQRILLSRLEEEAKEILKKIRVNVSQLEDQSSSLQKLISEIEEKYQQSATELLKDAKATLSRCEAAKFPRPEALSAEEGECSHLSFLHRYFILKNEFTQYRGKLSAELVNVTLDPETAHPRLVLSEDRKSVRCGDTRQNLLDTPQRFNYYPCVLGSKSFTSGRCYWEVEVGDTTHWDLGVCKDSVSRKGWSTLSPGKGYWAVGCWGGDKYWACTSPETQLPLSVIPRAVGILLDYEAGKVSFYNADDKSHFYTFSDTFTGELRPLFSTYDKKALRIWPVPDWE